MNAIEHPIDVREIPPRQRHPLTFKTWDELPTGGAILLINDHDPLPLYYQFAAEYGGGFRWEYLQSGPGIWEVRISKGEFVDPGFFPTKKKIAHSCVTAQPIDFVKPFVLDTRPIFAKGEMPCGAIDEAVANLIPGQPLILLVPFEPIPLYAKLGKQGFSHTPTKREDGVWRVEFKKQQWPADEA
jgi:uncharacterized protein (DUF2249 family)